MLFETIASTGHEQVVFCQNQDVGLMAIIAIHNTVLGPSLGGLRMWPYQSEEEALNDVLRLSRGMTYKNAVAGLNLGGGKIGDHVISPMTEAMGIAAFGKAPPDLSVIARVRGSDWIYTYLKSFYLDESRPVGWNNTLFANASMPNPLWELQGLQQPVHGAKNAIGEMPVEGFTLSAGRST